MFKGTKAENVIKILEKIPLKQRKKVKEFLWTWLVIWG